MEFRQSPGRPGFGGGMHDLGLGPTRVKAQVNLAENRYGLFHDFPCTQVEFGDEARSVGK